MKHYRQVIALLLATAMVAASIGGCASVTEAAEKESTPITESSGSLEQAAVSLLTSHGNEKGKNETVYIIADADGNIKKTEVSCWLKNPSENAQIKDHTSLSDIENVKGNESYKKNANGDLIWDAQGNDIVYQGIANASNLPISTSISYELDGKTVKADQLAGANGHLKVTFSYKNNIYKNVVIDGENTKLYQPFLVISGMLMDMDKASNVTVSNGKTIEFSDKNIVVGTAMPGLSDSLGLDSLKDVDGNPLDLGIPEDVVIEADIHDFSLLTTVTVYDNNALSSLDLDKVTNPEDLYKAVDKISDAADQLKDGCSQLSDGTDTLLSGSNRLNDGAGTLHEGSGTLSKNLDVLKNGIDAASAGAGELDNGINQIKNGIASLPDATQSLYQGSISMKSVLKSGSNENPGIYEAANALSAGAGQISAGLKSGDASAPGIYEAASAISQGAAQIGAGAKSGDTGAPGIYEAASLVRAGLEGAVQNLSGNLAGAVGNLDTANAYNQSAIDTLNGLLASPDLTEEQIASISGAIAAIGGSQQYTAGVSSALANTSLDLSEAYGALDQIMNGADAISGGAAAIENGAAAISGGADSLYSGATQLQSGAGAIASGVDEMISGNGGNNLDAMIGGLGTLSNSSETLVDGVDKLSKGSADLNSGAKALAAGSAKLSTGAKTLDEGAGTLANGIKTLADGAVSLHEGTLKLSEGMDEFSQEAIEKLTTLVDDDLHSFLGRLKALQDYSKEYNTFSGTSSELPCSVRFIMRTDSI